MDRQPGRSPQRGPSPQRPPQRQPSPSPQRPPQRPPSQPGGGSEQDRKQKHLTLLFDRPGEPVFMPRGDENAILNVPSEVIAPEYVAAREGVLNRNEIGEVIPVNKITIPDIKDITAFGKRENFTLFFPYHRKLAGRLIDVFMGMRSYQDFFAVAASIRDKVNPYLFNYALSVAILHRPDTKNVQLPPLFESFPDKYLDSGVFKRAREVSNVLTKPEERVPLEIPRDYTASDADPEHRLAYFREDMGINLHHWHWHLVYPFTGDIRIVNKDRRGELFYYMHEQIIARYNFERLCNNLPRVQRLSNLRDPLPEGYFSKLDSLVSSRVWPQRHDNALLSDIYRESDQLKFDISDMERQRDRVLDAIAQGFIIDPNGKQVPLDENTGIDILGNLIEASTLTMNANYYGTFHTLGHIAIGLCHDPLGKHLETFSPMADPATTMRDPLFYRWHAYIDYMFQQFKNTIPSYNERQLGFQGVRVAGLEVVSRGRNKNEFVTFWEQNDVNLSRGMDFLPRGNVLARITHLQHEPFNYRLLVENNTGQSKTGTVRIFLAPKFDERGVPWLFVDHKLQFVELDKFPITMSGKQTTVERKSTESSVTIPFEQTFRNLEVGRPSGGAALDAFNFCGCGWPQHMLLPRGNAEGFPCVLFAMVSDIDGDRVDQPPSSGRQCDDAASYCGIRDQKYPDKRSMGYPFDRVPRANVDTIRQFLTPNMMTTDVKIFFQDRVVARKRNAP